MLWGVWVKMPLAASAAAPTTAWAVVALSSPPDKNLRLSLIGYPRWQALVRVGPARRPHQSQAHKQHRDCGHSAASEILTAMDPIDGSVANSNDL